MSSQQHVQLAKFAESGDEAAFTRIVEEFGGLVFHGALRRTGDRQLAEEVAQSVFAITARKARQLSVHPQLKAWLHMTTRLEATKATQARHRYQRRVETFAEEMTFQVDRMTAEEQEHWRAALPLLDESLDRLSTLDREIVFGRFFEERSFREIAASSGSSEAACKMRLKRSLGKLHGWLTSRGVTLSAAALVTGLTTELSKATPAMVAASLPAKSLAVSSGLSLTTIFVNTLHTMKTIKSVSIAGITILTLGVIPVAIQQSQANDLRDELVSLQERLTDQDDASKTSNPDQVFVSRRPGGTSDANAMPVARFLTGLDRQLNADELIDEIVSAAISQDRGKMQRVFLPLAKLSPEEGRQLLAEVQASGKDPQLKAMAVQMLSSMFTMATDQTNEEPANVLDQNLGNGVEPRNLSPILRKWAKTDPDAAIAWFESRRDEGKLLGKGVEQSPGHHLLVALVGGLGQTDPDRALTLLEGVEGETRNAAIQELATTLIIAEESRDRALNLVKGIESQGERAVTAKFAAFALAYKGKADEAAAFVHAAGLNDDGIAAGIASIAATLGHQGTSSTWEQKVAWATENSPATARPKLIEELVRESHYHHPQDEISRWVDTLPAGAERDAGLAAESGTLFRADQSLMALKRAEIISDQALRDDTVKRVFIWANSRSAAAAEKLATDHGYNLQEVLGN